MPLATLQFPLYRPPYELGAVLAVFKNGVDAVKRALREACRGLLVVDLFPAHVHRIDDITNCYKPYLGLASLWIGDIIYASERRRAMQAETTKYRIVECAAYPGKFNCQRYEGFTLSGHIWRNIHSFCEEQTARRWLDQAEGRLPKSKRPARPSKWSKWR